MSTATDTTDATTNVIIYSTPTCAFCKTEKQYLDHLGVSYIVKDVEEDPSAMEELIAKSNQQAVPVTDIDGVIIRGFDRLKIDLTLKEKALV
jgi:glutaredoxin-like YruB-family protein